MWSPTISAPPRVFFDDPPQLGGNEKTPPNEWVNKRTPSDGG